MDEIKHIESYGNQLAVVFGDGSRKLAYPTIGDIWIINNSGGGGEPGATRFIWPFPLDQVTSEYGMRDGRLHAGIDFGRGSSNVPGSDIKASAAGKVVIAAKNNDHGGYGNAVVLDHGGGLHTLYGHMRFLPGGAADVSVSVGDTVAQGQRLGGIGNSGASEGNHLHFETHEGGYRWNASSRDPRKFFEAHNV